MQTCVVFTITAQTIPIGVELDLERSVLLLDLIQNIFLEMLIVWVLVISYNYVILTSVSTLLLFGREITLFECQPAFQVFT